MMIVWLMIWLVIAMIIGHFGRDYKLGFWGYFAASLFFSPLLALVLLVASDRRVRRE